uniref:Uncharacterized protein n=1 Tax=Rhizophora mucronata TaxID=61149 RepID=A0A2P2Q2G8_RHIMU
MKTTRPIKKLPKNTGCNYMQNTIHIPHLTRQT